MIDISKKLEELAKKGSYSAKHAQETEYSSSEASNEDESILPTKKSNSEMRNIIQMPLWKEFERGAPSCALRSSLFGIVKKGTREYLERKELAAWGDESISFTGKQLDQADLDVWLECLHLARNTEQGEVASFEKYSFLKSINRSNGKQNWVWLESSIERMIACAVKIKTGNKEYIGSLIQEGYIDQETGRYVLLLNPKLSDLFRKSYTLQHSQKRLSLKTDLSKWLCGYIESHRATKAAPHRVKIETLKKLCGSSTKELREFRRQAQNAASKLEEAGIIKNWKYIKGNDLLEFVKL